MSAAHTESFFGASATCLPAGAHTLPGSDVTCFCSNAACLKAEVFGLDGHTTPGSDVECLGSSAACLKASNFGLDPMAMGQQSTVDTLEEFPSITDSDADEADLSSLSLDDAMEELEAFEVPEMSSKNVAPMSFSSSLVASSDDAI